MTRTAGAVVIGGGVIGTSIAFHLASRGLRRVVVVERSSLAAGATGWSVGIVRQLYPTVETTQMVQRSLAVFLDFDERVGGALGRSQARAGYERCGVLIGVSAAMRRDLAKTLALQKAFGIVAELLEPDEVTSVEPRIDPAGLGAALWEPDSGYADPSSVTHGYAAAARRLGVEIVQGAEVTTIRAAGEHVTGIATRDGDRIDTDVVVNAAGLWSPAVARLAGLSLPIVIGRHPVFVIERDPAFGRAHVVYLDLAGGSYVRPETGGLTLTGSLTDDETQHPMDPELLGREVGLDEAEPVLERTGRALPRLADAAYRRGYAGAFDITPDWMPILDESPLRGFYLAVGMSGHGFKLAPAVGEMMSALVTGAEPPVSLRPFTLGRFTDARPSGTFVASYLGGTS